MANTQQTSFHRSISDFRQSVRDIREELRLADAKLNEISQSRRLLALSLSPSSKNIPPQSEGGHFARTQETNSPRQSNRDALESCESEYDDRLGTDTSARHLLDGRMRSAPILLDDQAPGSWLGSDSEDAGGNISHRSDAAKRNFTPASSAGQRAGKLGFGWRSGPVTKPRKGSAKKLKEKDPSDMFEIGSLQKRREMLKAIHKHSEAAADVENNVSPPVNKRKNSDGSRFLNDIGAPRASARNLLASTDVKATEKSQNTMAKDEGAEVNLSDSARNSGGFDNVKTELLKSDKVYAGTTSKMEMKRKLTKERFRHSSARNLSFIVPDAAKIRDIPSSAPQLACGADGSSSTGDCNVEPFRSIQEYRSYIPKPVSREKQAAAYTGSSQGDLVAQEPENLDRYVKPKDLDDRDHSQAALYKHTMGNRSVLRSAKEIRIKGPKNMPSTTNSAGSPKRTTDLEQELRGSNLNLSTNEDPRSSSPTRPTPDSQIEQIKNPVLERNPEIPAASSLKFISAIPESKVSPPKSRVKIRPQESIYASVWFQNDYNPTTPVDCKSQEDLRSSQSSVEREEVWPSLHSEPVFGNYEFVLQRLLNEAGESDTSVMSDARASRLNTPNIQVTSVNDQFAYLEERGRLKSSKQSQEYLRSKFWPNRVCGGHDSHFSSELAILTSIKENDKTVTNCSDFVLPNSHQRPMSSSGPLRLTCERPLDLDFPEPEFESTSANTPMPPVEIAHKEENEASSRSWKPSVQILTAPLQIPESNPYTTQFRLNSARSASARASAGHRSATSSQFSEVFRVRVDQQASLTMKLRVATPTRILRQQSSRSASGSSSKIMNLETVIDPVECRKARDCLHLSAVVPAQPADTLGLRPLSGQKILRVVSDGWTGNGNDEVDGEMIEIDEGDVEMLKRLTSHAERQRRGEAHPPFERQEKSFTVEHRTEPARTVSEAEHELSRMLVINFQGVEPALSPNPSFEMAKRTPKPRIPEFTKAKRKKIKKRKSKEAKQKDEAIGVENAVTERIQVEEDDTTDEESLGSVISSPDSLDLSEGDEAEVIERLATEIDEITTTFAERQTSYVVPERGVVTTIFVEDDSYKVESRESVRGSPTIPVSTTKKLTPTWVMIAIRATLIIEKLVVLLQRSVRDFLKKVRDRFRNDVIVYSQRMYRAHRVRRQYLQVVSIKRKGRNTLLAIKMIEKLISASWIDGNGEYCSIKSSVVKRNHRPQQSSSVPCLDDSIEYLDAEEDEEEFPLNPVRTRVRDGARIRAKALPRNGVLDTMSEGRSAVWNRFFHVRERLQNRFRDAVELLTATALNRLRKDLMAEIQNWLDADDVEDSNDLQQTLETAAANDFASPEQSSTRTELGAMGVGRTTDSSSASLPREMEFTADGNRRGSVSKRGRPERSPSFRSPSVSQWAPSSSRFPTLDPSSPGPNLVPLSRENTPQDMPRSLRKIKEHLERSKNRNIERKAMKQKERNVRNRLGMVELKSRLCPEAISILLTRHVLLSDSPLTHAYFQ
ncbi:hypothetical protein DFJ73DRAFT_809755 [Zopfochytrium polystomum]|nr:hypothetical protein DFJ73DRAFT_809755 [Zopfochytrium polystomum]